MRSHILAAYLIGVTVGLIVGTLVGEALESVGRQVRAMFAVPWDGRGDDR